MLEKQRHLFLFFTKTGVHFCPLNPYCVFVGSILTIVFSCVLCWTVITVAMARANGPFFFQSIKIHSKSLPFVHAVASVWPNDQWSGSVCQSGISSLSLVKFCSFHLWDCGTWSAAFRSSGFLRREMDCTQMKPWMGDCSFPAPPVRPPPLLCCWSCWCWRRIGRY